MMFTKIVVFIFVALASPSSAKFTNEPAEPAIVVDFEESKNTTNSTEDFVQPFDVKEPEPSNPTQKNTVEGTNTKKGQIADAENPEQDAPKPKNNEKGNGKNTKTSRKSKKAFKISDKDLQEMVDLSIELDGGDRRLHSTEGGIHSVEGGVRNLQVVANSWRAMRTGGAGNAAVGVTSSGNVVANYYNSATSSYFHWYYIRVSGSQYGRVYHRVKDSRGRWRCLDNNFSNDNAYVHFCNGSSNQRWKPYRDGELKSLYNGKCLDFNFNTRNLYMHSCHGAWNQEFSWQRPPLYYAIT